ncbi:MAG: hypothetical protein ACTHU0_29975 [Kofleriaceae bacterium]
MSVAIRSLLCCAVLATSATCAKGGSVGGDDEPRRDAPGVVVDAPNGQPDAPPMIDAPPVVIDAPPSPDAPPPDAPPGSIFCASNAQCTNAGECCLLLGAPQGFCVPGTVVLGQCFPIN